jgi:lysophospholipase L1-like esterase
MRAAAKEILDEVPDTTPLLEYFQTFFRKMVQRAAGRAQRVIVVRQPWFDKEHTPEEKAVLWNFGVGRPYVEEVTTYYSHRVVSELMRAVDEVAVRVAAECGVEQLDLMPVLDRSLETYYDFLHFTPEGARVVGETVAAKILEGMAPADDAPATEAPSGS